MVLVAFGNVMLVLLVIQLIAGIFTVSLH